MEQVFDVAIIGGGINGCGIAADAATRGLSVVLIEKDDLASKTSSNSSKLIHGGLRYLEYYDFALVKKALDERQTLLKTAPHLVHPLSFVLPYDQSMRPTWILRTGLFLYDHLSRKNKLPKSRFIRRKKHSQYFYPLNQNYQKGFIFSDCATDDSRLTIANAMQAKEFGAVIHPHCELISGSSQKSQWDLQVRSKTGQEFTIQAKTLVNATGPWVEKINARLGIANQFKMSLVKGSHLVVHKLYEGDHAYLLQNTDNRIVFLIPYHGFTIIGTTDIAFNEELDEVVISPEETNYLLALTNRYLKHPLGTKDIVSTWSGVRPLIAADSEKPQALSRDYAFHYTSTPAPAVSIYGGKITTYRQLSKETVDSLHPLFPTLEKSSTQNLVLPGGKLGEWDYKTYLIHANEKYYWLDEAVKKRILQTYGTNAEQILNRCDTMNDLGYHFGQGLYQAEVDYLVHCEWAVNVEDILNRRTRLGLIFDIQERKKLEDYLEQISSNS